MIQRINRPGHPTFAIDHGPGVGGAPTPGHNRSVGGSLVSQADMPASPVMMFKPSRAAVHQAAYRDRVKAQQKAWRDKQAAKRKTAA